MSSLNLKNKDEIILAVNQILKGYKETVNIIEKFKRILNIAEKIDIEELDNYLSI